ncbi:MAG: metallophosphoesterase [Oscillospiraceae bacterium]|nr:metallophosphoesterase [Oscillospiraceae bacterium]
MRIIIFSDSHGGVCALRELVASNKDADFFIHLGDCVSEAAVLRADFPDRRILCVMGNCDLACPPGTLSENILNHPDGRIFYTHGHRYGVKKDTGRLLARAKELGAKIACFGHTHAPLCETLGGVILFNPGSTGSPRGGEATYGLLDITNKGISARILPCRQKS